MGCLKSGCHRCGALRRLFGHGPDSLAGACGLTAAKSGGLKEEKMPEEIYCTTMALDLAHSLLHVEQQLRAQWPSW